ncbi:MAG: hypothetical protein P8X57_04260 [Cyclobacteriaceae bacterium]
MPRSKSNALFELIHSLKPAEKRYFTLWASRNGTSDKKFLQLFDAMCKQDNYDESALLEEIPEISERQISNMKAHLYQRILQALRQYSQSHNTEIQLREMIDHVQLLFNRGLYDQCNEILKKARKRVGRIDNLELQLEILKWEKNIITHTIGPRNEERVNRIVEEVQQVNERINNVNEFTNLAARLNAIYYRIGFIRNKSDHKHIEQLIRHNLPSYEEEHLSLTEKLSLYQLLSGYYSFIQDFDMGLHFAQKWIALFDDHRNIRYTRTNDYLSAINTLMIIQYKLFLYDAFVQTSRRLREIRHYSKHTLNENIRMRLYKYTYVHEFNRIFMLGDFSHGVSLINRIEHLLDPFIRQLDNHSRLILYYKIACLYFGDAKYGECIQWLNRVNSAEQINLREDIHSFARILSLISHYELGNTDVIEYYIRSTYRFLLRRKDLYSFQKYIIRFLKKLNERLSDDELINAFAELRDQLRPLQNNPYERRAFMYFDIISWLESKLEHRPVGDVINEKAMSRISASRNALAET